MANQPQQQAVPVQFYAQEPVNQAQGAPQPPSQQQLGYQPSAPSQQQLSYQPIPANVAQQPVVAPAGQGNGYPQQPVYLQVQQAPVPTGAVAYSAQTGSPQMVNIHAYIIL